MIDPLFWAGKRVFITGHTGFKGTWLTIWLTALGAEVTGYALAPHTSPSLFEQSGIAARIASVTGDIRDRERLLHALKRTDPHVIFHLAALPLVRESYENPVGTYEVNVMGTVHLLECVRALAAFGIRSLRALINVTTDKVYENKEWTWGYREVDGLGGTDPYSNSKACSELVTAAYRASYFPTGSYAAHDLGIATARAGNVIGGGDWTEGRLVPDCIRALLTGEPVKVRNPQATRPWQHVLDPLAGYLTLAHLLTNDGARYASAWNFGPDPEESRTVASIAQSLAAMWGGAAQSAIELDSRYHEAGRLALDCAKARAELGWRPRWNVDTALAKVLEWVKSWRKGKQPLDICIGQIRDYSGKPKRGTAG